MLDGRGSSETPDLNLYDMDGKKVGNVSWNCRVWLKNVEKPIYEPSEADILAGQRDGDEIMRRMYGTN